MVNVGKWRGFEQTEIDDKSNSSRPGVAWIVHILLAMNERQCSSDI